RGAVLQQALRPAPAEGLSPAVARERAGGCRGPAVLSPAGVRLVSARRYIAYGAGGAFQNVVLHGLLPFACDYAVDNFFEGTEFHGIPVRRPSALDGESREDTCLVLFAMSSAVYRLWRQSLIDTGFPERNILYYGDLFFEALQRRL